MNKSLIIILLACLSCTSKTNIIPYTATFPVETIVIDLELTEESMKRFITPDDIHRFFWVKLQTTQQLKWHTAARFRG